MQPSEGTAALKTSLHRIRRCRGNVYWVSNSPTPATRNRPLRQQRDLKKRRLSMNIYSPKIAPCMLTAVRPRPTPDLLSSFNRISKPRPYSSETPDRRRGTQRKMRDSSVSGSDGTDVSRIPGSALVAPLVNGRVRLRLLERPTCPCARRGRNQEAHPQWFCLTVAISAEQHRAWSRALQGPATITWCSD